VLFFQLDTLCGNLKTFNPADDDFGCESDSSVPPLIMPEDLDPIFTSELVRLYHAKCNLLEINVIPLSDERVGPLRKRYFDARREKSNQRSMYLYSKEISNLVGLQVAVSQIKIEHNELLTILSESTSFADQKLPVEVFDSGQFELNPDNYIDYSNLSVTADIQHVLDSNSTNLVILTRCKLNPSIREFSIRHWSEIVRNHFMTQNTREGTKIPSRESKGFIIKLLIYLQTVCEEKVLQQESNFELVGIDSRLFSMLYFLDLDCFFRDVRLHLQNLTFDETSKDFLLLIHVVSAHQIFKSNCFFNSKCVRWSKLHLKYFVYRLYSRFHEVFRSEGLDREAKKLLSGNDEYWARAENQKNDSAGQLLFGFLVRLIRIPYLQTSLDFRVFTDIGTDDLQNREVFNTRTKIVMEKINQVI